jgi:hypothetical protein
MTGFTETRHSEVSKSRSTAVQKWLGQIGMKTLYLTPGVTMGEWL